MSTWVGIPWRRMFAAMESASRIAMPLDQYGVVICWPVRTAQPCRSFTTLNVTIGATVNRVTRTLRGGCEAKAARVDARGEKS
jgi:hypothetical protein